MNRPYPTMKLQLLIALFTLFLGAHVNLNAQQLPNIPSQLSNSVIVQINQASVEIDEDKPDAAFKNLMEAINSDSTARKAYLLLYQVASLDDTKADTILSVLLKACDLFVEDDELNYYCAEIYRHNDQNSLAIERYSSAIEYAKKKNSNFFLIPFYYQNRGIIYLKQSAYDLALADFTNLLKLDPISRSGLINRGYVYYVLHEKELACKDWQAAVDHDYFEANRYLNKYCK